MDLFPYPFRKNQKEIMHTINNSLQNGTHFVFESGTGSGKTICALASTLSYAVEKKKNIVYTTRTNAQQRQVIIELRAIRKKTDDARFFGVGIQGRSNMCSIARHDPDIANGTSEELSRYCTHQKKQAITKKNSGCKYFRNFTENKEIVEKIIKWTQKMLPTAEELIRYCEQYDICPYEVNKVLISESLLVVVPYVYIFDRSIRNMFLDWLSVSLEDIILIVDEAHNLPEYLRELYSTQLSLWMLNTCVMEAEKFGDPSIANGQIKVSLFCKTLIDIVSDFRDTYIYKILENGIKKGNQEKIDAFIPAHEVETEILSRLKITSKDLRDIISDLIAYGEKIQEYRQREGKLPRSYLHKLGVFLEFWMSIEMEQYIKLLVDASSGKNPRIEAYCLDPSIGTKIIGDVHCSIHMSGTLEPLEEYRDSLGLPKETELVFYPSPFSITNRRIFFVRDVTTKYDEIIKNRSIVEKMWHHITTICNSYPRNTIVFFPSYNMLSLFLNKGSFKDINRCLYIEDQHMSQAELMDLVSDFKSCGTDDSDGATLFSVMGGRISEGMDFPAEQLEIAVIVGIPYPKPTARQRGLQRYYDLKFGKGWEYTVDAPTARKLLQSIGRLIRDENDKGVAIILDKRAPRFRPYIKDMKESKNLVSDIDTFINLSK